MRHGKEKRMSNLPSTREAIREQLESRGRNRAVVDAAQWFAYGHLSKGTSDGGVAVSSPYDVSSMVAELAAEMIDTLPDSPELTHALRRLIEAKDCLVRAAIAAQDGQPS
jgi:hypothetical protein